MKLYHLSGGVNTSNMKVLIVGASGMIGSAIAENLSDMEVIRAGYSSGDVTVDLENNDSIATMYKEIGKIDAVVCASGKAAFGGVDEITEKDVRLSILNKLGGQINLVRIGLDHVNDGGSFTLTSGDLSTKPDKTSSLVTAAGIGVEGFARASAISMPRGIRINVISPSLIRESAIKFNLPLDGSIPVAEAADWFRESLTGEMTGMVRELKGWL